MIENFPITDPQLAAAHIGTLLHTLFHGAPAVGTHTPGPVEQSQITTTDNTDPVNQVRDDPGNQPKPPDATITTSTTGGEPAANDGGYEGPVPQGTPVTQPYGASNDHDSGGHPGVDLGVPTGTSIHAPVAGTVTWAGSDDSGYGTWVQIQTADGHEMRFGHLSATSVNTGDTVRPGQQLGVSGSTGKATGPHLHFEVRQNGHTVDPTPWLAAGHPMVGANPQEVTVTKSQTVYDPQQVVHAELDNTKSILIGKSPTENPEGKTVTTQQKFAQGSSGTGQPGADDDPNAVDSFLAATRKHESGGNYQIYNQSGQSNASGAYQFLGSTWKSLGGSTGSAAEASPEEQDRIARNYALQLFQQFHSWKLVAAAWYGGPGIAQRMAQGQDVGAPSGQGAYAAYAQTIGDMMARGEGA